MWGNFILCLRCMENGSSGVAEDHLAKKLFGDSPPRRVVASPEAVQYDLWGSGGEDGSSRKEPRVGCFGAAIFFTLCVTAVVFTLQFNAGEWRTCLTMKAFQKFFSNELLAEERDEPAAGMLYFHGNHLYGFGALSLSIAVGVFFALFTCIFTFYDSNVPGNFPPTPVSARTQKDSRSSPSPSQWHLAYIFVLVNCVVAFSLSLFCLRWNMGLPLL